MELPSDLELSKEENLLRRFEEIHNYIYANDGLSPQQTLEEFVKVLFIKIYDENNHSNSFKVSADEFNAFKSDKVCKSFTERISGLLEETKSVFKDVFDHDEKIRLTDSTLAFIVNKLQTISLTVSSQDAKGLAFQKLLSHHEKDGKGQFFTPEPVVDFCVKFINPQPEETIIDPCCGSGGFLFTSFIHLKKQGCLSEDIVSHQLYGLDINKSIARIAKMKLLLEANTDTNINCINSLEDIDTINLLFENKHKNGFDILLTNPPFGTAGKITNPQLLSQYELGHKWVADGSGYTKTSILQNGQTAEVLFIERCLQLLREGGRMAIVLPNGHFENPSLEYLRFYIKQKAKILGVVNLPQETFIPFGTGVKTSLLFLQKETAEKPDDYSIYFGRVTKLGYQGNKNGTPIYKKNNSGQTIKENDKPVVDENFSELLRNYHDSLICEGVENPLSFTISYKELNGRLDFDFYSPENRNILSTLKKQNAVRLGDIVDIVKTKSKKLKNPEAYLEYVELSDVNSYSYEIINSTSYYVHELPSRASYELKENDIITAIAGNSVGSRKHATALVDKEYEGAICTNGFRILRNPKIDIYYLLLFLRSELFLKQMHMFRTGAAIPNVSDSDLSNILISIPDDDTMKIISNKVRHAFNLRRESRKELDALLKDQS